MNILNIKFSKLRSKKIEVYVNNEKIKLKKQIRGIAPRFCSVNCEGDTAKIQIRSAKNELDCKHWFWWQMLYFFISVFGIFDMRTNKSPYKIDYEVTLPLENNQNILIKFNKQQPNAKAFTSNISEIENQESNIYSYDEILHKRRKKLNIFRFSIWGILAISILLIILL